MPELSEFERSEIKRKTALPMLYISMGSMVMLFAGLTSAYIVRHAEGNWIKFNLPQAFYFSTALILLSSATMNYALQAAKKNNFKNVSNALMVTFLLGIGFVFFQFRGWASLVDINIYFTGKNSNASGQYFYILTWLHLAHMLGGIISLGVSTYNASKQKYTSEKILGLKLTAVFWHFLDILWLYLFVFLSYIG